MSAPPVKMNPFPGLRPFTQEEDYLFFGREEQTLELLQRLGSHRFVAVVGSSGSGKSSLVRCGLLSELMGGRMLDAGASWEIAVTHPGGNPLALLTEALLEADLYDRRAEHARENLLATLSRSHFGLVEAVKQADLGEGTNFLVVVDQFEEIFRFHEAGQTQQEAANEFVSLLLEAVVQKEVPIYVVLTMRSDFIGECGQFEGLAEMVNRGEFLIPRLTREQYKRVIEGPIKVAGGQIAPRLLQRLLNDLGQQADQLPCLQHALMRTWDVWAGKGDAEAVDLDDYQRVGKMSQALSLHADEIYESLVSDRQRELCQGMFQALTVEESNSRGIRRPQRLGRLCQILEVSADELLPIIDAYRRSGVTFLMPSPEVELTDQTIIDVSHESLMRVWTKLRQWVEEETQAAGIYHRLSESANLRNQGKAGLYRDPELGIALAWREAKRPNAAWADRYRPGFATAIEYLEASQQASVAEEQAQEAARQHELERAQELAEAQELRLEQQQRSARKLRVMIGGLAVVAIVAVLACLAALVANNQAKTLAGVASKEADEAMRQKKLAEDASRDTQKALIQVASQKAAVESSLTKAKQAEQVAQAAEEAGRKLLYTTDMRLAPFVWRDDRTTAEQLRVLLAKHIPESKPVDGKDVATVPPKSDLRGFEWRYYQHLLENSAAVLSGHGESVVDGAFTANGPVVTLDQDGQLRRWDLSSQAEDAASRHDLPRGPAAQRRVLSPNGRLAALADGDKVHVFDTSTGDETFRIDSANKSYRHLIFSRDEDRFVIVDDKIRWCSALDGKVIASVDQKSERIESLALSADGLTLAVVGHGQTGQLISVFRLDMTAKVATPLRKDFSLGGTLHASAMTPDGQRVAAGAKLSGTLAVFDTATGRMIAHHGSAHASPISAMVFSRDGARLATADGEGTIKIWADPQKLNSRSTALLTLKGHQGAITTVGFSMDGKRLITTSADKTSRVWDLENAGAAIRPLEDLTSNGSFVARFSPDDQLIAIADGKSLRLWDAATGRVVRELSAIDKGRVSSVAFSPTDHRMLAVGYGGAADLSYVTLWDIDSGTELARLPGATDLPDFQVNESNGVVGVLRFSPDGKYLVAGFGSKNMLKGGSFPTPLKVWEVATRRLIRRLNGHMNYCVSLDFLRDGMLLASGSRDGTAILWSTATWKATRTLQNPDKDSIYGQGQPGMVEDVTFSPDGKTLAMASREANLHLWDVDAGKLLETLKGHSSAVTALAFSPDGRTLASGSVDQTVRLWNVETRRELMQLDPGGIGLDQIQSLAFSPDGQQLLAAGDRTAFWSTTAILWNDPDRAAEKLRMLLKSNADFPSRIRMLSENLRLHEALAMLDAKDRRVQAALAATQANWHASRHDWAEAVRAFDRLVAADPSGPNTWLRMPGLLRLATALLHQNRPAVAASLLQGGARRRTQDGLPAVVDKVGVGVNFSAENDSVRVTELSPGLPDSRAGLVPGDIIVKVNETEMTGVSIPKLRELLAGEAGTKVRLTVRHSGSDKQEVVELTRARFVDDPATGELLYPLRAAINERLDKTPRDAGLLELRAELAGQWSDWMAQVADYTAAIESMAPQAAPVDLKRLHGRRGNVHLALRQWQPAVDDYAHVVTDATTDDTLLSNQALALAEVLLPSKRWTVLKPVEAKSELGSTLSVLPDDSILASGANPLDDRYRVVMNVEADIELAAVRLEALTHDSLPRNGPGRYPTGTYAQTSWKVIASLPGRNDPIPLEFGKAWADQQFPWGIQPNGHLNIAGVGEGRDCTAIWATSKPVSLVAGAKLTFEFQFKSYDGSSENLGHFRLSVSSNSAAIEQESELIKLTDPWQKLAAAYELKGDQKAIDQLVERHPKSVGPVGDLFTQGKNEKKDWKRAIALYSKGITEKTTDAGLLSRRARAYEALKNWEAAAADWSQAATGNPEAAKLLAEFARRLVASKQFALARAPFEKAQALYEQALKADPDSNVVAVDLAQLLLDKVVGAEPDWVVLKPVEPKTESGSKLTLADDGSILVEAAPNAERQTVRWQPSPGPVQALRIETSALAAVPTNGAPDFNEYQIVAASMATSRASALRGRFVRLDLPGDNSRFPRIAIDGNEKLKTINLAEFQVFQGDRNIALRKKARQSSGGGGRLAPDSAVDGNTVGNDEGNPYAHTGVEDDPWWEVDLGSEQAIDRMVIWNRTDTFLFRRMNHFRIRVLDRSRKVVFERVIDRAPSPSMEIVPPALLAETSSVPAGENPPLILRLPLTQLKDAPSRFRVSVAAKLPDLDPEEKSREVMKVADVTTRLATAYAMNGRNEEASRYFGIALEQAEGYEARKPIIELAAGFDEVLSALTKRQPDDPQLQLAFARKLAERGQQRLAEKQPAKAQAELEKSREILTRLLTESAEPQWTVLKVKEMTSAGGATLTLQDDGSILASGKNTNRDTYTLTAPMAAGTVTGLRLETIPDSRLDGGAGRVYGEFFLSEITVTVEAPNGGSERPLDIKDGFADFSRESHPVAHVFDRDHSTSWGVWPRLKERHTAVLGLESNSADEGGNRRLKVRLQSASGEFPQLNLGRFRLSVTNQVGALRAARLRNDLKDSELVDLNIVLAKAHAQQGNTNGAVASFAAGLSVAGDHGGKARIIAEAAPLAGVLEILAERVAGDGLFQAELARYFTDRGNAPLADAARTKARRSFEQKLAQETENSEWAVELADLLLPPIDARTAMAVPTSENEAVTWRFSTTQPSADWMSEAFDDSAWKTNSGSFGNGSAQGLVLRTEWKTRDIWLRRKFEWKPDPTRQTLLARVIHDDGFELFINGQQVLSRQEVNFAYTVYPVDAKALSLLRSGINMIAVHCSSTLGNQYIDAGLLGLSSSPHATEQRLMAMKMTDPWAKLAAAYHFIGDQPALDRLLPHHPAAASGIGDLYAVNQDWKRALAEYDTAVTGGSKDAGTFAARAEAHEKLEHWKLAVADWGNADLHAVDKRARYGNPSRLALEHRAQIHNRLQQYEKVVVDSNELLKPERLGDDPWMFKLRGEAYDQLRQWQKARADYDRAIKVSSPTERGSFHFFRALHFAAQGQWKQAAKDLQQVYEQPADFLDSGWPCTEWWALRDAALIYAIAGDVDNYDRAVAGWYRKQSAGTPGEDESKWTVLTMLQFPETITNANRPRLMELAGKTDAYWRPRLTAAIQYRSGDFRNAAEFFDANDPGAPFLFLAAMNDHKLGKQDRAKQRLNEGNAWIQEQREKDRGAGVPRPHQWLDWAHLVTLQYEASESIAGPGVGSEKLPERATGEAHFQAALARHYDERDNEPLATAARTKARLLFEQKLVKEPENFASAAELADLLFLSKRSHWHVLRPAEMKTAAGATLTLEPHNSIFVSGNLQAKETYTLDFHDIPRDIKAIRLEALRDDRLPSGGPGTNWGGNFVLSDLTVSRWGKTDPMDLKQIPLRAIFATFEERRVETSLTKGESGWSIHGATGKSHRAIFAIEPDKAGQDSSQLRVVLDFYHENRGPVEALLGRFRFSVSSDDPNAIVREEGQLRNAMKISDPWAKLGAAYILAGDTQRAADLLVKSGGGAWIASWLESGLSIDEVFDSMQARHPEKFATLSQGSATVAAERGQIDPARTLYSRLVKLQPKNGLWKERTDQLRPGVLGVWNFDNGVGPWGNAKQCVLSANDGVLTARTTGGDPFFSTPISAPAGGKAIVLRYRTDRAFTMQLYWSDTSGGPDDFHHGDYPLSAAAGVWQEAIIPFSSQGTLNLLRLDPNTAPDHPLDVDSILLRELEPGDIGSLPTDNALLSRLAATSQAAGRTREALLFFARASADNPKDTSLSLKLAVLQAWLGQEKELAATRQRVLAFAKVDIEETTAERAAKVCGVRPSTDKAEIEAALALARTAVKLRKGVESWNLLALGISEYRSGNHDDAEKVLLAAGEAARSDSYAIQFVPGTASFFRAMSLFQQGKRDEARNLAIAAAAKMKPLPADDQNPLAGDAGDNDLYVWLAYKEAKAMIQFDAVPAAPEAPDGK